MYLEIPRDMVSADIDASADVEHGRPGRSTTAPSTRRRAKSSQRLTPAERPVLIVGVEVHRFQLREQVIALAERLNVPVASSFLGRGVFPTLHPQFVGTYLGVVSPPALRETVEQSDCVLLLGELVSDTSLGVSADRAEQDEPAHCRRARRVHRPPSVPECAARSGWSPRLLASAELPRQATVPARCPAISCRRRCSSAVPDDEPIKVRHVIAALNEFLADAPRRAGRADTGDCLFAGVDIRANEIVAPAYYATMGFAVPAALGVQIASRPAAARARRRRRVSDDRVRRSRTRPNTAATRSIVLFNNTRWEMLQAFFPDATLQHDRVVAVREAGRAVGRTRFRRADAARIPRGARLGVGRRPFALIEVTLAPGDLSPILRGFVRAFKARVYEAPEA